MERAHMGDGELKNKLIELIESKAKRFKTRPQSFTPKELAHELNAAYGSIGKVADAVVRELNHRGFRVRYERHSRPRKFVLL